LNSGSGALADTKWEDGPGLEEEDGPGVEEEEGSSEVQDK